MKWSIRYYSSSVADEILKFPDGLLAKYLRLIDLMEVYGANLGLPHTKVVEAGLLELRVKGKEGIARAFFCTRTGREIIILHSFIKKTQRIPARELKIARKRLREVLADET